MNPKRLILAIVAVFIGTWITDFLIHGVWLVSSYQATMNLWRPDKEMQAHMGWLMLGQFLLAITFVVLCAKGFAQTASIMCGCFYGLFMALFSQAGTLITYAVQPIPGGLAVKWFIAGVIQGILLGLIVWLVYKPKAEGRGEAPAKAVSGPSAS